MIDLELLLESLRVRTWHKVVRARRIAVAVFRDELLDTNTVLLVNDSIFVVVLVTVWAVDFGFFDIDEDFVRERNVHECVEAATVLLKELRLVDLDGEVDEDHAVLSSWRESQKLQRDLLPDQFLLIARAHQLCDLFKERVVEVGVFAVLGRHVLHQLVHRDDGHAKINRESVQKQQSQ